jgi:hypothetical protein
METKTLEYDIRKKRAKQVNETIRSFGLIRKKSGLEEALEDVANGRITTIHTPSKRKI